MILGLMVGLVVIGAAIAMGVMLVMRGNKETAEVVPNAASPAPMPAQSPLDPSVLPMKWGWSKLTTPDGRRSLGFYYVDKMAGPSLRQLIELDSDPSDDAIRAEGQRVGHCGSTIVRVGGHEWVNGSFAAGLPPEAIQPRAGMSKVIGLTDEERERWALPAAPGWIATYL